MNWREVLFLMCAFLASVLLLSVAHHFGEHPWAVQHLSGADGSDGVLWQVQTTFFSVGFAGLAIAAQLFAEAPLAIGASRARVLKFVGAGWFLGVGITANTIIAVETIWLPSTLGLALTVIFCLTPTIVWLVMSTARLSSLFGRPSQLDEVVRQSMISSISKRLHEVSGRYPDPAAELGDLMVFDRNTSESRLVLNIPVPEVGRIVRAVNVKAVRLAMSRLTVRPTEGNAADEASAKPFSPPGILQVIKPGSRTHLRQNAFRIYTGVTINEDDATLLLQSLQMSIEFEPISAVTSGEETGREIEILQDSIRTKLRSGGIATAERGLELLGGIIQGVWISTRDESESVRTLTSFELEGLMRSIAEVEDDAILSPRIAHVFIDAAMSRAVEAPRVGSTEYVDECLQSFTRLWFYILGAESGKYDGALGRITICVQNLAAYSYALADNPVDLQSRATWVMVELVKLAIDAKAPEAALRAATELNKLFDFDRRGSKRSEVRAGMLALSAWLDYLAAKNDERDPMHAGLRALVTPTGSAAEIMAGGQAAERQSSRWSRWELGSFGSSTIQSLEMSHFVDQAQVRALSKAQGKLPPANTQERASDYERLLRILSERESVSSSGETRLRDRLQAALNVWKTEEQVRLSKEPLSQERIVTLRDAIFEALNERKRISSEIPDGALSPDSDADGQQLLGMNFLVPRDFMVDRIFDQTYADPSQLGRMIAQGFVDAEERKIVTLLRGMRGTEHEPNSLAIGRVLESLGDAIGDYVLVAPFGGMDEFEDWYSAEFAGLLRKITLIESAELKGTAILFDRRNSLVKLQVPEEKAGLSVVDGTTIAVGIFEDAHSEAEPQVRVEAGEIFDVGLAKKVNLHHFRNKSHTRERDPQESSRDEFNFGNETRYLG